MGESFGPELTPTEVARKHGISTGQLYTWRQQMVSVQGAVVSRPGPRFTVVELSSPAPESAPSALASLSIPAMPERSPGLPAGLIEILLPGGVSLRVDAQVERERQGDLCVAHSPALPSASASGARHRHLPETPGQTHPPWSRLSDAQPNSVDVVAPRRLRARRRPRRCSRPAAPTVRRQRRVSVAARCADRQAGGRGRVKWFARLGAERGSAPVVRRC